MKKCVSALGLLLMLFSNTVSFAQSEEAFEKNDFIVNGGFGVGFGYGYQNYTAEAFYTNYSSYSLDINYTIGAVFPVTAEYAISNKFGLGLAYQHGSYINTNSDKSSNNNFGIFGAFHFAKRRKLELYTRLILGYSLLDYTEESSYYYSDPSYSNAPSSNGSYQFKMKGAYAKPSFGMRLYFTEHLGMFVDIGIGIYSYKTGEVETDLGTYNLDKRFHYVMFNGELTTGLAVKF
jgi:hypothetical protein